MVLLTIASLIICGGLGFSVINDTLHGVEFKGVSFSGGNLTGYAKDKAMVGFGNKVRLKSVRGMM